MDSESTTDAGLFGSAQVSVIKTFAISSVVCAHVALAPALAGDSLAMRRIAGAFSALGSTGVGLFFLVTGYGLAKRPVSIWRVAQRLRVLIVPWIVSASVVYASMYIRKPEQLTSSFVAFVVGNGSYLYFMSVYFAFVIVSPLLRRQSVRRVLLSAAMLHLMFGFRMMPAGMSDYLNPLLWLGYFIVGYNQADAHRERKLQKDIVAIILVTTIWLALVISGYLLPPRLNYLNPALVVVDYGLFMSLPWLLGPIARSEVVARIGSNTLFVYLWHMPLIGLLNYLVRVSESALLLSITPIAVLGAFYFTLRILRGLSARYRMVSTISGARLNWNVS